MKKETYFYYLYRDSGNYKTHLTVTLSGSMTEEDYKQITACCDSGEYFLPSQVGLPNSRNWDWNDEYDNPWFELVGYETSTEGISAHCVRSIVRPSNFYYRTPDMSVSELVKNFEKAKEHWDTVQYPHG